MLVYLMSRLFTVGDTCTIVRKKFVILLGRLRIRNEDKIIERKKRGECSK